MFKSIFKTAKAEIRGGSKYQKIKGTANFRETKRGVIVTIKVEGLPQSKDKCKGRFFALHIHSGNSCTGNSEDEFVNALIHYNPDNCKHPYHAGDLPPIIENDGYAYMEVLVNKFTVEEIIGKVIIIHDSPDDFTSQPSGNSGTKIACGKIK